MTVATIATTSITRKDYIDAITTYLTTTKRFTPALANELVEKLDAAIRANPDKFNWQAFQKEHIQSSLKKHFWGVNGAPERDASGKITIKSGEIEGVLRALSLIRFVKSTPEANIGLAILAECRKTNSAIYASEPNLFDSRLFNSEALVTLLQADSNVSKEALRAEMFSHAHASYFPIGVHGGADPIAVPQTISPFNALLNLYTARPPLAPMQLIH